MGFSQGAGMAALLAAMASFSASRRCASTDAVVRRWRSPGFTTTSLLSLLFLNLNVSPISDLSS